MDPNIVKRALRVRAIFRREPQVQETNNNETDRQKRTHAIEVNKKRGKGLTFKAPRGFPENSAKRPSAE